MKSRFKAILLIVLCLLVQAVSVYPHHHHADALCTKHGMEASSPARAPQPCTAGCITHFNLTVPETTLSVSQKSPSFREAFRAERPFISRLQPCAHASAYGFLQAVSCPSPPVGGAGLRAPPFAFFSF